MRRVVALFSSVVVVAGLLALTAPAGAVTGRVELRAATGSMEWASAVPMTGKITGLNLRGSVALQQQAGASWVDVARPPIGSGGNVSVAATAPTLGTATYRLVHRDTAGRATASKPISINVRPRRRNTAPIAGETVTVDGRLASLGARPVQLERYSAGRWTAEARATTSITGAFGLATPARAGLNRWRVHAPAIRIGGRGLSASTYPVTDVTSTAQRATITTPPQVLTTQQFEVKAQFTPARAGRTVALQGRQDGAWIKVAEATQDAQGTTNFTLLAGRTGTFDYRAVAAASRGAAETTSPSGSTTISQFEATYAPESKTLTQDEADQIEAIDLARKQLTFDDAAPAGITKDAVLVIPPRQGLPSGAIVRVTDLRSSPSGDIASIEDADLTDVITTMPESQGTVALCPTTTEVEPLLSGVEVIGVEEGSCALARNPVRLRAVARAGATAVEFPKIRLRLSKTRKVDLDGVATELTQSGQIAAGPVADLDVHTDWLGQVDGYRLGTGMDWDTDVKSAFKIIGTVEKEKVRTPTKQELAEFRRVLAGSIGPVPVWVDITGTITISISASGEIEASFTVRQTGRDMAGLKSRGPGDLSPTPYQSRSSLSASLSEVKATGTVTGKIGADAEMSLYSAGGPFIEVGGKVAASISSNSTEPNQVSCEFEAGPYATIGARTSNALKKFTGGAQPSIEHEFYTAVHQSSLCPPGTTLRDGPATPTPPEPPADPDPPVDPDPNPPAEGDAPATADLGGEYTFTIPRGETRTISVPVPEGTRGFSVAADGGLLDLHDPNGLQTQSESSQVVSTFRLRSVAAGTWSLDVRAEHNDGTLGEPVPIKLRVLKPKVVHAQLGQANVDYGADLPHQLVLIDLDGQPGQIFKANIQPDDVTFYRFLDRGIGFGQPRSLSGWTARYPGSVGGALTLVVSPAYVTGSRIMDLPVADPTPLEVDGPTQTAPVPIPGLPFGVYAVQKRAGERIDIEATALAGDGQPFGPADVWIIEPTSGGGYREIPGSSIGADEPAGTYLVSASVWIAGDADSITVRAITR